METVTITIAAHNQIMFDVGQQIELGDWPRWMYWFRVRYGLRRAIQRIAKKWAKKTIGPQLFTITSLRKDGEMVCTPHRVA